MNIKNIYFLLLLTCSVQLPAADVRVDMTYAAQRVSLKKRVLPQLQRLSAPNIIVWYSGEDGLTERARDFYRNNLIQPLQRTPIKDSLLYLYDLRAWKGLSTPEIPLGRAYWPAPKPDTEQQVSLQACYFFTYPENALPDEQHAINQVLGKRFIWRMSEQLDRRHGITCQALGFPGWLDGHLLDSDSGFAYSALQYLESLWLLREIVARMVRRKPGEVVTIAFVLPSVCLPEWTYYVGAENSGDDFARDIKTFLELDERYDVRRAQAQVCFYGFEYSAGGTTRPYVKVASDTPIGDGGTL